jgi:transcriptional regulator PpsR
MLVLCRVEAVSPAEAGGAYLGRALTLLYRHAPDAIVFTDPRGDIVDANEAFLILGDVAQLSDIAGEPLADFFQRGSVDVKVMLDNAARTGRMRHYASKMKSAIGTPLNVEVSATHLRDRGDAHFAFVIRDTSRVGAGGPPPAGVSDEAVQNVIELVGTAPLKELVSATTDVVEKLCIETAVQLTNNNRVAAAEMLGLSRQSLYVKLRKYGLLNKSGED